MKREKDEYMHFRIASADKERARRAAKDAGMSLACFARIALAQKSNRGNPDG